MTMRKPVADFSTVTPCRVTTAGSPASACASLFWTCTCAISGSVPISNVNVTVARPVEVVVESI